MLYVEVSAGHLYAVGKDVYISSWAKVFTNKLHYLGLSGEFVHMYDHKTTRQVIDKQINLFDQHYSRMNAKKSWSPANIDPNLSNNLYANYLKNLTIPKYRLIFTKARFNCLPFTVLDGRYNGIPYENRLCPCNDWEVESLEHVLLECR